MTLSIDDKIVSEARRRAEAMGTSVNQLIRDYLAQFAGEADREALAAEFVKLSKSSKGNSRGWKFDREEAHRRR